MGARSEEVRKDVDLCPVNAVVGGGRSGVGGTLLAEVAGRRRLRKGELKTLEVLQECTENPILNSRQMRDIMRQLITTKSAACR